MQKLKYEDRFKKGDKIRAYDFLNVRDHFVEGTVIGACMYQNAKFYLIQCEKDSCPGSRRLGDEVLVPFEELFESEWKFERVIKL